METKITLGQIKKLIPTNVNLYYVDYQENLSRNIDELQQCISENCWDKLYEELGETLDDSRRESLEYYKIELKDDIISKFNLDEDEANELVCETYRDEIEENLYERDESQSQYFGIAKYAFRQSFV